MLARPMLAHQFMVTRLITLHPDMDVFDAIALLLKHRISGAPVLDDKGNFLGVFSEKSCMKVLIEAAHDSMPCATVDCFINTEARTIDEDTDLLTITHIFNETPYRRLPVLRDGKLVGQVSRRDVLRAAHNLLTVAPDRETALLYLSGLHDRNSAPIA